MLGESGGRLFEKLYADILFAPKDCFVTWGNGDFLLVTLFEIFCGEKKR